MSGVDRRQLLGAGLLVTAMVSTPFALWNRVRRGETGDATEAQRQMLAIVSQLVIPATDTPGAADVDVPAFVELALNHGQDGTRDPVATSAINGAGEVRKPQGGLYLLDQVQDVLDRKAGGDFNTASAPRQLATLIAVDTKAFAPSGDKDPWHKIKNLILTGYYTSEAGGSKELRYELVPGRWDADIPLKPTDRAFSSDWTAVDFG